MELQRRFLRSKVARRIFLLFIACSLLPSIALSLISSRFVTHQLETQQRKQLHQNARTIGMGMLGRLAVAESELRLLALAGATGESGFGLDLRRLSGGTLVEHFHGLALLDARGDLRQLTGTVGMTPRWDESAREHLRAGGVQISTRTGPDGQPRILLGKTLDGASAGSTLVGEVSLDFLWGLSQGVDLPKHTELLVLDSARNVMFDSSGRGVRPPMPVVGSMYRSAGGSFEWEREDVKQLGYFWTLPLEDRYASESWTIAVNMPRDEALASLARFRRLLSQVSLVCLGLVLLLSFVQIRRSLVPLESLRVGTERIARREFEARVRLETKDEFEELATSFNAMAEDLGRQFNSLATLAEIDHAILSSLEEDAIVRTVLGRIPGHFSCHCVAVTIFDATERGAARSYARLDTRSREDIVEPTWISAEGRRLMTSIGTRPLLVGRAEIPPHLVRLTATGITHCMLSTIRVRGELAGCIALGYQRIPRLRDDDFVEARRLADQVAVALANARLVEEMQRTNLETLHALARAVDANSPWTAGHSDRVTTMAVRLARGLGLPDDDVNIIQRGGWLHDIGKIGVPTNILDKPGPLTQAEMLQMQDHPVIGARILEPISAYARELPIVLYHHERFDGKGYPEGLAGEEIPFHARVLAIADVFDALISDRPYRAGWERERVIRYIADGSGTLFDPQLIPVFMGMMSQDRMSEGPEEGAETGFALMSA